MGRFRETYHLANETYQYVVHYDKKVQLVILFTDNTSLDTSYVSNFTDFLFQLFRWIKASSQGFLNSNKDLILSKQTTFLNLLVMYPKVG